MLNRRTLLMGAAGLAVAGTFTACSGGGAGNGGGGGGNVTIELWDYLGQGASNDAMEAVLEAFKKTNPEITVNRTSFAFADLSKSLVQGGVGGSVPDLAICDNVDNQNFAALGLLTDITSDVADMKDDFYEGPWNSGTLDGKNYGLPLNSNNLSLFYNKDMLDKAGLQPPTTWDELTAVSQALSTAGVTGLAVSGVKSEQSTFQVLPFVWQAGGDLDNYDVSGGEALGYLKGLIDAGYMSPSVSNWTQEDCRTQFTTQKVAMMFNGPWELPNLTDVDFQWGVVPLPKHKAAATGLGGENVVAFQEGKEREAAITFLKFITSAEGAKIFCNASGQLSSRTDLAGKLDAASDPNMQVFEKQLEIAQSRAYGKEYAKISEAVQLSIQEALTGSKTPEQAAKDAFGTIKPLLGA